jgi:hypothetical protein
MASNEILYANVKAKAPLDYKTRKALLSHWSPRIAKAICGSVYPDFRGTYEQHLWLLTLKAAEGPAVQPGYTSYAEEARQKGIKFLKPKRIEDVYLCSPSHYLHYIVRYERSQVNALLTGANRRSERLNTKYLSEALRLNEAYAALPQPRSNRFDDPETPQSSAADIKARLRKALNAVVKAQMMLSANNLIEFKAIAYGWTHLRSQVRA